MKDKKDNRRVCVLYLDRSKASKEARKLLEENGIKIDGLRTGKKRPGEIRPRLLTGEGESPGLDMIQMYIRMLNAGYLSSEERKLLK